MNWFPCFWFFIYVPDDSNSHTRGMEFLKFEVSVSVFRNLVSFAWNDIFTSSLRILVVDIPSNCLSVSVSFCYGVPLYQLFGVGLSTSMDGIDSHVLLAESLCPRC
jgi:hypothetical protein